jgi:hypothetical protein
VLQSVEAGTGTEEEEYPSDASAIRLILTKKFRGAKTEEDAGEQIGRSADQKITNPGGDRAYRPEEILSRMR